MASEQEGPRVGVRIHATAPMRRLQDLIGQRTEGGSAVPATRSGDDGEGRWEKLADLIVWLAGVAALVWMVGKRPESKPRGTSREP
jgi:hypothetical protein